MNHLAAAFICIFCIAIPPAAAADPNRDLAVELRIIDSVTETPISDALISLSTSSTQFITLGRSTNGAFTFSHAATTELIRLRVQRDLYSNQDISLPLTNSLTRRQVRLDRIMAFRGVAIAPDGEPASRAQVVLVSDQSAGINSDGTVETDNFHTAHEDGWFDFKPKPGADAILLVHESGVAQMPLAGWKDLTRIRLRPWTTVKGRMSINNTPAANEGVIATLAKFPGCLGSIQLQDFETQTDAAGNFVLKHLPPGEITLFWKMPIGPGVFAFSHGRLFEVDSAAPVELNYEVRGRAIRGQALISMEESDWKGKGVFGYLRSQPTEFDPLATPKFPSRFGLRLDQNGKFEAEAIPPGSYKLFVHPLRQTGGFTFPMSANLVVREGSNAIDFGQIIMTNNVRDIPISGGQ